MALCGNDARENDTRVFNLPQRRNSYAHFGLDTGNRYPLRRQYCPSLCRPSIERLAPTPKQRATVETAAQQVLAARAAFPAESLATLCDPLTMPPALVRAHAALALAEWHACTLWLLDGRRTGPIEVVETNWLTNDFFPDAAARFAPHPLRLAVLSSPARVEQVRTDPAVVPHVARALSSERPYRARLHGRGPRRGVAGRPARLVPAAHRGLLGPPKTLLYPPETLLGRRWPKVLPLWMQQLPH